MTTMNELAIEIHTWAKCQGFYTDTEGHRAGNPAEKLMLIVSECAETLEALRHNDDAHESEEVADIIIRTLDYAAWRGIDIDNEVAKKMATNRQRPYLHGKKF